MDTADEQDGSNNFSVALHHVTANMNHHNLQGASKKRQFLEFRTGVCSPSSKNDYLIQFCPSTSFRD